MIGEVKVLVLIEPKDMLTGLLNSFRIRCCFLSEERSRMKMRWRVWGVSGKRVCKMVDEVEPSDEQRLWVGDAYATIVVQGTLE